jgi:outer membrane protein TolC
VLGSATFQTALILPCCLLVIDDSAGAIHLSDRVTAHFSQSGTAVLRTRLAITREVRTALANLGGDQERVKALETSVTQAQEALRLERLKYQAGRNEINFVLDAEAALLTNDFLLREGRRATQIDRLALDLSLGSIAENSLRTPTSPAP